MHNPRYALVAYVRGEIGDFVSALRQELHPHLPHLPAHVTFLPPRHLKASELSALGTVEEVCSQVEPFQVTLGEAETFVPVTPTVFIRVGQGAEHIQSLHDQLNVGALNAVEEWPFMPHLTIAKLNGESVVEQAYITARDRWAEYAGSRRIAIRELTFVCEHEQNEWKDLAAIRLGRHLVKH